jgi:fructosamine-3-kinase
MHGVAGSTSRAARRVIDLAALARELLDVRADAVEEISGGDSCRAARVRTADGAVVFVKGLDTAPDGLFEAEAAGLRWLGAAGAPVPSVLAVGEHGLALSWHEPGVPSFDAATRLGRDLASLHGAGAPAFGALPPGAAGSWVGSVAVPVGSHASAGAHLAARLHDAADRAADRAALAAADHRAIDAVCDRLSALLGPDEPPARLHGDLWSGNLLWARTGSVVLIDPAAHGGHRETDLAMLALFGQPYLDTIVASYQSVSPLLPGWETRVALHQLHPLLIHAALFGGGYGARAGAAARRYL